MHCVRGPPAPRVRAPRTVGGRHGKSCAAAHPHACPVGVPLRALNHSSPLCTSSTSLCTSSTLPVTSLVATNEKAEALAMEIFRQRSAYLTAMRWEQALIIRWQTLARNVGAIHERLRKGPRAIRQDE